MLDTVCKEYTTISNVYCANFSVSQYELTKSQLMYKENSVFQVSVAVMSYVIRHTLLALTI